MFLGGKNGVFKTSTVRHRRLGSFKRMFDATVNSLDLDNNIRMNTVVCSLSTSSHPQTSPTQVPTPSSPRSSSLSPSQPFHASSAQA